MQPRSLTVEQRVAVPLPDGTTLRADVWRPAGGAPVPAILMRTPYGRRTHALAAYLDPLLAGERGYATVIQDVRGRGDSEGEFEPFVHEAQDGADTIAWLAAQPWCDGRVVMAGHSYIGATQWHAATRAGEALRAIAPVVSSADQGEGWSLRNGVREHGFLSTWAATGLADAPGAEWLDDPTRAYREPDALARAVPWSAPWWDDATPVSYWAARSAAPELSRVRVPALHVGGWYDGFVNGTIATWRAGRGGAAGSGAARAGEAGGGHPSDRLILGPWGHDHWLPAIVGEQDLGWRGDGQQFGLFGRILDFYDAVLAGREPAGPPVSAFLLGARRWVELPSWPPPAAREVTHPLGTGAFAVDPADLPPALGGRGLRMSVPDPGFGPRDQRPLAAREDVLALPLGAPAGAGAAGPLTLAGPVTARLRVSAAGGTMRDWVVTLCVERADGVLWNVCEGIVRAETAATEVEVPLGDAFVQLAPGERLVALVAGAAAPRWPAPAVAGTQRLLDGSTIVTYQLDS